MRRTLATALVVIVVQLLLLKVFLRGPSESNLDAEERYVKDHYFNYNGKPNMEEYLSDGNVGAHSLPTSSSRLPGISRNLVLQNNQTYALNFSRLTKFDVGDANADPMTDFHKTANAQNDGRFQSIGDTTLETISFNRSDSADSSTGAGSVAQLGIKKHGRLNIQENDLGSMHIFSPQPCNGAKCKRDGPLSVKASHIKVSTFEGHYVDACIFVRLKVGPSGHDRSIINWLEWHYYAGMEKAYIYDTSYNKTTDLKVADVPGISELIDWGLVKLIEFPMPVHSKFKQKEIKTHANEHFVSQGWRFYTDVDEYIFSPTDTDAGFLRRYLERLPSDVSVVDLDNYIFGGSDKEEISQDQVLHPLPERFLWRAPEASTWANKFKKYIAKPLKLDSIDIHRARPKGYGVTKRASASTLRFNHYWGRRVPTVPKDWVHDRGILWPLSKARTWLWSHAKEGVPRNARQSSWFSRLTKELNDESRRQLVCFLKKIVNVTLGFDTLVSKLSYRRCAVVSSSGALKLHHMGADIDKNDVIIRFNDAPVVGFEDMVGARTDVRFVNGATAANLGLNIFTSKSDLHALLVFNGSSNQDASNAFGQVVNAIGGGRVVFLKGQGFADTFLRALRHLYTERWFTYQGRTFTPTIAAIAMILALTHCRVVHAYDMFPSIVSSKSHYHYYGEHAKGSRTSDENTWHKTFGAERNLWPLLSNESATSIYDSGKATIPGFMSYSCDNVALPNIIE